MDRNRDLSKQLARLESKIQEQMDLDYARHGVTIVEDDYETSIQGDFYGIKADGEGTAGLITNSITIDGVTITIPITIANGDTFYGNITAVRFASGSTANAILLHKKGHGPSAAIT